MGWVPSDLFCELLQVAEVVSREKGITQEEVILAMEHAMQRTAKQKYGADRDIRVSIDRESGCFRITRCMRVVDVVSLSLSLTLTHTLSVAGHRVCVLMWCVCVCVCVCVRECERA